VKHSINAHAGCHDAAPEQVLPPDTSAFPFRLVTAIMDQNGRSALKLVINGPSQPQQASGSSVSLQNQSRSLSVDEALQYSSMSSAPVFGLGLPFHESPRITAEEYLTITSIYRLRHPP